MDQPPNAHECRFLELHNGKWFEQAPWPDGVEFESGYVPPLLNGCEAALAVERALDVLQRSFPITKPQLALLHTKVIAYLEDHPAFEFPDGMTEWLKMLRYVDSFLRGS